ncbi:coadhesin-like [Haliotis rufescens]|uniref:coadhesin-like n=1 Tax=Haliotis rufescens TaxID=6454 RepID=UPI00201EAFCE|nr:coadhesin-like [Haliotis rufescens]
MTNQSRRRDCVNPAPEAGGKNCTGPLMESSQTHCNVPPCSGDDGVGEWSQWSAAVCTTTCGEGQKGSVERSRSCVTPANNISCTAALTETQMGNCGLPKCPVDGGLSNWTSWSIVPCPLTCGVDAMTNQSRRRDCNNPAPEAGGKNCTGPLIESSQTHCNVPPCSVDGGLSNWTSWSIVPCPLTCGVDAMTNQSRRRDCNNPAPEAGGKNCTGPLIESSQTHCNVPPCSGDDGVGEWSQWSAAVCTTTCGEGQKGSVERSRSCVTPANNISCTAALTETQMGNCGLPKCPVDGGLSNWTSWSIVPCPLTCGVDAMTNQSRRRDCNNPAPEAGGKNCTGPLIESSQTHCNVPPCSGM